MEVGDDKVEISREQFNRLTAAADELASARNDFESQMAAWEEEQNRPGERASQSGPSDQALMALVMWSGIGMLVGVVGCWDAVSEGKGIFEGLKALVVGLGVFVIIGLWRASKK